MKKLLVTFVSLVAIGNDIAFKFNTKGPTSVTVMVNYLGVRHRNGEAGVQGNGCPKACFWRPIMRLQKQNFSGILEPQMGHCERVLHFMGRGVKGR